MKKAKLIGTIIGIIVFISAIAGLTYAWFTWRSNNVNISGATGCFTIDYTISQEIGATSAESLKLGTSYTDGKYAEVTLSLNSACTGITGKGSLYLNTKSVATDDVILGGALNYTVVKVTGSTEEQIKTGTITTTDKITVATDIPLGGTSTSSTYRVYVWINGEQATNSYANAKYSGFISAEAVQDAA